MRCGIVLGKESTLEAGGGVEKLRQLKV